MISCSKKVVYVGGFHLFGDFSRLGNIFRPDIFFHLSFRAHNSLQGWRLSHSAEADDATGQWCRASFRCDGQMWVGNCLECTGRSFGKLQLEIPSLGIVWESKPTESNLYMKIRISNWDLIGPDPKIPFERTFPLSDGWTPLGHSRVPQVLHGTISSCALKNCNGLSKTFWEVALNGKWWIATSLPQWVRQVGWVWRI